MMDDVERNVEIMVCAFIALGIIVVAGYFVFQKMEVADKIGVPEYPDLMQYLLSQSIIYWIIALVIGFFAIIMLYIQLKENMWGLN